MNSPLLHVFSQSFEHDDAAVVGTREALLALKAGIERALADERGVAMVDARVNDGEGFFLNVYCVDDRTMRFVGVPYADRDVESVAGVLPCNLPAQPGPMVTLTRGWR